MHLDKVDARAAPEEQTVQHPGDLRGAGAAVKSTLRANA